MDDLPVYTAVYTTSAYLDEKSCIHREIQFD